MTKQNFWDNLRDTVEYAHSTSPTEGVTYTSSRHSFMFDPKKFSQWIPFEAIPEYISKQSRSSIFHKSGGSIQIKKKNEGKFSKVRDYVDYKNSK